LSKLGTNDIGSTRLQNLTREPSYDIVNSREHSQVLRRESHYCRYAARISFGLAVFDCPPFLRMRMPQWSQPGILVCSVF
jgi:hypothetical protein